MALPDATRKLTYEDYAQLPEDGNRHEILAGEHYVTPSPFFRHQLTSSRLHSVIGPLVAERGWGILLAAPMDVVLSAHDIAQPDLLFISNERSGIITEKNIQGAPDLVIEILSRSSRRQDEGIKLARYDLYGVLEYWLFDPDRRVAKVYRRDGGKLRLAGELSAETRDFLTTPLLPGLEISLRAIFA